MTEPTRQQRRKAAREDSKAADQVAREHARSPIAGHIMPLSTEDTEALTYLTPAERARYWALVREQQECANGQKVRPLTFREFIDRVTAGRVQWYKYAVVLSGVLQRVADGLLTRVMIFAPPRHGKSELVSRLFPAYYLYRHTTRWVGLVSFGAELANTLARAARGHYFRARGERERGSVKQWDTQHGGGMWSAGIGGTQLGKGYDVGVIDDPLKNAEEAASERRRERHKDWFRSTFSTRQEPGAALVIIMQRWAEDDLCGWLLQEEWAEYEAGDDGAPEHWHIVNFEAVKLSDEESAEEERRDGRPAFPPTCTVEPDWREPGEALCPERMDVATLRKVRRRVGEYYWWALYQQRPRIRTGTIFQVGWLRTVGEYSRVGAEYVRWWDKATSTSEEADYTVGALICRDADGVYTVVDIVRGRWSAGERDRIIRETCEEDRRLLGDDGEGKYRVWGEQEPGSSGVDAAALFRKLLEGFRVHTEPTTGDKVVNAGPLASAAEGGNLQIVRATWNGVLRREFADFPRGQHDDIVDACARGYNKLARRRRDRPGQHGTRSERQVA